MQDHPSPNATILLLDSYPAMRAALGDALQDAGYLVSEAADLGGAVDRLNEVQPDLLIIPPYINSMPGQIAADYLRSKHPGLPVLMIAGFIEDDRITVQNTIREFHTFPRPFSRDELLAKLKDVLKHESDKAIANR